MSQPIYYVINAAGRNRDQFETHARDRRRRQYAKVRHRFNIARTQVVLKVTEKSDIRDMDVIAGPFRAPKMRRWIQDHLLDWEDPE